MVTYSTLPSTETKSCSFFNFINHNIEAHGGCEKRQPFRNVSYQAVITHALALSGEKVLSKLKLMERIQFRLLKAKMCILPFAGHLPFGYPHSERKLHSFAFF